MTSSPAKKKTTTRGRPMKKGESNKRGRNVPWDKIRLRYVSSTGLSLREVAAEFHVHYWPVQKRAKLEDWQLARREFLREVLDEARTKIASELAQLASAGLLETLKQLGDTRRAVLTAYIEEIGNPDTMRPMDQQVVKQTKDEKTGAITTTTVRRGRAPLNSKLADTAIKLEAEILLEAAGYGRAGARGSGASGAPDGDEEVVIE